MAEKKSIEVLRTELNEAVGNSEKQDSLYAEIIKQPEAVLEDYLKYAIFLRDAGQSVQSLQVLDDAEKKFSKSAWIEDNRARAFCLLDKLEDAASYWEKAYSIASEEEKRFFLAELNRIYSKINEEIFQKITHAKNKNRWDDVIDILQTYKNQVHNLEIYLELAIAYRNTKEYKKALEVLKKAEKNGLESPWIHDNYSRVYFEKKLYAKAIRECLIALKLSEGGNRDFFINLLKIIKNEVDSQHAKNQHLNIVKFDIDELIDKIFEESVDIDDIVLEKHQGITISECKKAFESLTGKNNMPQIDNEGVKLIAYYLPQFHPIMENDEWWGPGFTEWTNVSQAVPYFKDHYQPHIPGELGYYDLRLPEVREAQAKLAREYGIYGFCYYYYWFSGRRLLERPLQEVFESGKPDFPFCICWANENWSRRWDGSENEVLVQQVHNEQTDEDFIRDVIPLFKDPRYIRVNGAPLLMIYRISLMPNPKQTAQTWRDICAENGIPEIHLCMIESFGLTEPRQYGFDSSAQFPPHGVSAPEENSKIEDLDEEFTGKIYDFEKVIKSQFGKEPPPYKRFPGVMTAWDNTARKKKAGNVFINSTPELYEVWLRGAIDYAKQSLPKTEQLVFINAWNEWAEGTHLEPDRKNGRAYLEATRRALLGNSDWHLVLDYAKQLPELAGETKKNFLADMQFALERLTKVNEQLLSILGDNGLPKHWTNMKAGWPVSWKGLEFFETGFSHLDSLNHYTYFDGQKLAIDAYQKLWVYGWAYHDPQQILRPDTPTYIVLENVETDEIYCAPIIQRHERQNIADLNKNPNVKFCGIKALIDISIVPKGNYYLKVGCRVEKRIIVTPFKVEIEIA